MRIALRTFTPLRYSMLHYARAVSNITTVVFDADDALQLVMLRFSCDYIIYIIIRHCSGVGAFPRPFCVPNSVALASLTLQVGDWAIH